MRSVLSRRRTREAYDLMTTLYLLRHAKSSWDDRTSSDFDRPLAPRGFRSAPQIGRFMRERELYPRRILCSAALRTRETLSALLPHLDQDLEITISRQLYNNDADGYLAMVREQPKEASPLMLIGHNPAMQDLANALIGDGETEARAQLANKYPTAGLAVIRFQAERWKDIGAGAGVLELFTAPKQLD